MAGTVDLLAAKLAQALRPLAAATQTDDGVLRFVELLGWELPSVPPSLLALGEGFASLYADLGTLAAAQGSAEMGGDDNEDSALAGVVADLALVIADVHALPDKLRAELPVSYVAATQIDQEFEGRVFDWLISFHLAQNSALAYRLLRAAGVIEVIPSQTPEGDPPAFEQHRIHWDRLLSLPDPASLARDVYGWGTPTIDASLLFSELVPLSVTVGMPGELHYASAPFGQAPPPDPDTTTPVPQLWIPIVRTEAAALFVVVGVLDGAQAGDPQGLAFTLVPSGVIDQAVPLGDALELDVQASAQIATGAALVVWPNSAPTVTLDVGSGSGMPLTEGQIGASLVWTAPDWQTANGLAASDGTSITAAKVAVALGAEATTTDADVFAELSVDDGKLAVGVPADDGFLTSVAPSQGLTAPFSFDVRWSRAGVTFKGSASLTLRIPLDLSAGFVRLSALELVVGGEDGQLVAHGALSGSVELGPIELVIQGIGIALGAAATPGNLGPVDVDISFLPPSGLGVAVNAGVVTGGGFIGRDASSGRYAGVLELRAADVDIAAIGLLDTKLPSGQGAYALVIVVSATFPGVEVGFGFALTGVGGLLALNRHLDVDALRARLAAGTAGRILAPQDPIRNAPALLADLDAVLPLAPGITVVGPTVKLVWAGLVNFDVGVFLELPGPARVVVLGSAYAEIASGGRTYLSIRVDVVGVVDLRAATAAFDAVLVNSHLMGMLDLTGGAAFRLSWGSQPYAVLTLGGFNPNYNPAPLSFPSTLTRIAMVHGKPSDAVYLRFEGYFAVTSNTLQFGAAVEAAINDGGFSIHGSLGFDALIQFVPFHFEIDIRASVSVAYHGNTLAGLTLTGSLTGPGPVVLKAKVCIELLFFDICFSGTYELGPSSLPPQPPPPDLFATLVGELTAPNRLRAAGGPDPLVQLRPPDSSLTMPLAIPTGTMVWEQQRAPLDLLLTRIGGTPLPAPVQVNASSGVSAGPQSDWFAAGQFLDLTDDQALTQPGYELLTSGVRLSGTAASDGPAVQATMSVRQIRLPAPPSTKPVRPFPLWVLSTAPPSAVAMIAVTTESWVVVGPDGTQLLDTGAQARQLAALTPDARAIPATDELAAVSF